jgi:hypothetical protein
MLRRALAALSLFLAAGSAWAAGPMPPCGGPALPAWGAEQAPPQLGIWTSGDLRRESWQPAPCLGWSGDTRLVVALASTFRSPLSLDQLLQRLTAISAYPFVKYWSATRGEWRPLSSEAGMLAQPQATAAAPDPAAADLVPGRDFYYFENGEVGGRTVHRLRIVEHGPERAVIASENVGAIRVAILTVFEPGALQYATFLERAGPGLWRLYQITRVGMASSSLAANYSSSYANRLEAIRRYLAGEPTDGTPPLRSN